MAISLKHKFISVRTDGVDPTVVQPSDWNDEHQLTMTSARVLGRTTAGAGAVEELTQAVLRTFLGLGTAAYATAEDFLTTVSGLTRANNLGDVANTSTARANIGANNASNLTTGTVADARLPARLSGTTLAATYLGKSDEAADSDKLDGQHGSYYRDVGNATGTLSNSRLSARLQGHANMDEGTVGTYGFMSWQGSSRSTSFGTTRPGGDLYPTNSDDSPSSFGPSQSGTWRCFGRLTEGIGDQSITLFGRIS